MIQKLSPERLKMAAAESVTRGGVGALDLYCRKASAKSLKRLALSLGAGLGTNKTQIREHIVNHVTALEDLRRRRQDNRALSIVSIDAGVSNFALARFSWSFDQELPSLIDWKKIELNQKFMGPERVNMSLHPEDTSEVVYGLTQYLTSELPVPDIYTIERQRARSMSSRAVLEPILKVNILEQLLFSNLRNKVRFTPSSKLNYLVLSSDPQRMTSYWCDLTPTRKVLGKTFPKGSEEAQMKISSNRLSKSIKINLVKRILKSALYDEPGKLISLGPGWNQKLKEVIRGDHKFKLWDCAELGPDAGAKKDDDLADSFLHGLAWMEWLRAYEEVYAIVMKEQGKFDPAVLADFNNYCKDKKHMLQKFQRGTSDTLIELEPEEH